MVGRQHAVVILAAFAAAATSDRTNASGSDTWRSRGCAAYAPESALRSAISIDIVLRVMRAESGGDPRARSPKGAMGCMQIMPATWRYLSPRYGLGTDPYDTRMNMVGGALYLAELVGRFGAVGAFAAYNAGPKRYLRFLADGEPLPPETVAYVGRIGRGAAPSITATLPARWQEARLFVRSFDQAKDASGQRDGMSAAPPLHKRLPTDASDAMPVGRAMPTLFPLQDDGTAAPLR